MQDIHSIGGGGGAGGVGGARLFGGVGGGGDRRLRPHGLHHQNNQALKCPRCDSLNTKFCYYNNYNLSQPRHFCKSCRRYWTKGGVLRNVPVGGGCRKTKRSKPKQPAASPAETTTTASQQQENVPQLLNNNINNNNDKSSNSHSSSESSSLTATNTTTTANTTIEAVSSKATTPTTTATNNNGLFSGRIEVETSKLLSTNPSFEQAMYEQYPDMGSFTGLMSTPSSENMGFGFGNVMNQQTTTVQVEQQQGLWEGGFEQNELRTMQNGGNRGGESGGGFGGLDNWQGSGDQGLFDIPNAVDQSYWTQNQWSGDQDHHPGLYLP